MGALLSGDLTMPNTTGHPLGFWCTLVFEAMRRVGFGFTNTVYAPGNKGAFYIWPRDSSKEETVALGVTFRSMWDCLSTNSEPVVLEFWPWFGEQYFLQVVIRFIAADQAAISLGLPIESLPVLEGAGAGAGAGEERQVWLSEVQRRLCVWLGSIKQVAELCGPSSVELEWERWGSRYWVGSLSAPSDDEVASSENSEYYLLRRSVRQISLVEGFSLHLVNPFPIPFALSWEHVPLECSDAGDANLPTISPA